VDRYKLIILLFLFIASPVHAGMMMMTGDGTSAACTDANPVGNCTGFLFCQNFQTETTGYDNGPESWTESGTVNPVSSSPALRGKQSAALSDSSEIYYTIADTTDLYAFARYQFADATPTSATIIFRATHGTGGLAYVTIATTGKLNCYSGTINNQASSALSPTTTYYIWFHATANSGATDGIMTVTVSTTPNISEATAALGCSVTAGDDADAHISRVYFGNGASGGAGVSVDQLLGKTTAIGTVCP
jgi:hypothetical protein